MKWLRNMRLRKIESLKAELDVHQNLTYYTGHTLVRILELKIQIAKLELKVKK